MNKRDDFSKKIKDICCERVGNKCSNPYCRRETKGPHSEDGKRISIGQAAHITAAAPGGPRYDANMTPEQRRSETNAIWLCNDCAKMIDSDETVYSVQLLYAWKTYAEYDQFCILNQRQNIFAMNMQQESRKNVGCREIKMALEELHNVLKYAYLYYNQNFADCFDSCLENEIVQHYQLYAGDLTRINTYREIQDRLIKSKLEYALDIGCELCDRIDEYSDLLNFVYQTDGWGGYDNYWSCFFEMVVNNMEILERKKEELDIAIQQKYLEKDLVI